MEAVKAAFLYATNEDQKYCTDLRLFIAPFERKEILEIEEFDIHLTNITRQEAARFDVFFCLISPAFLYFFLEETTGDLSYLIRERKVVPILIRPSLWHTSAFADLEPLPQSKTPVTLWVNTNEAFLDIANGIKIVAENIQYEKISREQEQGNYEIEELLLREEKFFTEVEKYSDIFEERYKEFQQNSYFWNYFLQKHGYEISGMTRKTLEQTVLEAENVRMREINIQQEMDEISNDIHTLYKGISKDEQPYYCLVIYDLESASYNDYSSYKSSFSRNYGKFMTLRDNCRKYGFNGKIKIAYKVFTKSEICD